MMKQILFAWLCLFGISVFSQNTNPLTKVQVYGKVVQKDTGQPLEYATIAFVNKGKIVGGGITNNQGKFKIDIPKGIYDITIDFVSFKTVKIPEKKIFKNTNLGTIALSNDFAVLDAVTVRAEKTTVEIKLDKKIYNVGKDLTVRGGSVSDVLDNVPSVTVDAKGNVSLRGSQDVRILINGKPSALTGLNSADALRQLPAESIDRIEVITSPSARYDAEGTAGIINIILHRNKLKGLNGSVTLTTGYPFQAGITGNVNYNVGAFNFFNTTGYNYRKTPGSYHAETEFFNGLQSDNLVEENRIYDRMRKSWNTNTGVEIHLNKSTSLTTSVFYAKSKNEKNVTNTLDELDTSGNLMNRSIRKDPGKNNRENIQYTLNFDKQFNNNSQHKLSLTAQYENNKSDDTSLINQDGLDVENVLTNRSQNQYLLQADYVLPVSKKGQFEAGYRGQFKNLNTDYFVANSTDGQNFINNTNLSNDLNFEQNVNAGYLQYGNKIKNKFSYLLGLRVEATDITIDQKTIFNHKRKQYVNYFPTLNLSYKLGKKSSITFGLNRRIRRPRSHFLNPFPSRSSATNIFQGNPDLDPTISNMVELGYLAKMRKLTLNSSIYYSYATDAIFFVSQTTGETVNVNGTDIPVIKLFPINLATVQRYGGDITIGYRAGRKFYANTSVSLFKYVTKGTYENQIFDADNFSWFFRLNAKYVLPGKIAWQTKLFYRGPKETAQGKRKAMFSAGMAFSKDILKNKGSLSLNISDLFNTRKYELENITDNFHSFNTFQWRKRTITLSFSYRFNQKKHQKRRMPRTTGDDGMEFGG